MYILKQHIRFQIYGSRNSYPHPNPVPAAPAWRKIRERGLTVVAPLAH